MTIAQPIQAPGRTATAATWDRILVASVSVVIAADIGVQVLARTVIPPLAMVTTLGIVGLVLFRFKRRAGIVFLGALALLWSLGSPQFSLPHLSHPESGIDFVHAAIEVFGRVAIVVAAVGAWRGASPTVGRRFAAGAVAALGLAAAFALVAMLAGDGGQPQPGDVVAIVEHAEFPQETAVDDGGTLFVKNADLFRHTYTIDGTALDVDLPAKAGVRIPIDLPAGSYTVICAVPGHEFMEATLTVR